MTGERVLPGTKEHDATLLNDFFRPSGAWAGLLAVVPSDESLGYYRSSLWDYSRVKFPALLVDYRITGFLDEIYATLVVRLHHSPAILMLRYSHFISTPWTWKPSGAAPERGSVTRSGNEVSNGAKSFQRE